ncbi:cell division protein ZapA [Algimonas arctica]|uniref:Cell division protein ZapA n=1 Tax=Algimonas arctica TaxID=1479486 RepID=A0A8J3CM79_9PROT|nr:cell division protein ZapA [Algimonas arctica]GHA85985.1 cell division protein ZapA [Algimonas arctica]
MGKVSLNINGRAYGLGCEAGEEERLTRLGQRLDARVAQMADQFGQIGDLRLLVMAGITLIDEIEDPESTVELQIEERLGDMTKKLDAATKARESTEVEAVEGLMTAARRIERLAERLAETGH